MTRPAIAIAAALAAASVATLVMHARARDAWQRERDRLGTESYEASRSDAAWDEARAWRTIADRVALAGAAALVLASALASTSASASASASPSPSASASAPSPSPRAAARLLASTALDASALAAWIAATRAIPTDGAVADALGWWLPALALASHAALLARGATMGMRLARVRVEPPPWWRVLIAATLTAPAVVILPLALGALALGARTPRWLAPHLALAGIRLVH